MSSATGEWERFCRLLSPEHTNEMLAGPDVRLVIVGLVVVAVAGAAATGAFSTVTAERDVTVSVATDTNALLAIQDGHPNSGLIEQDANGALSIRFDRHGGEGVNRDVVLTFGDGASPVSNHAFSVENDGTQSRSVDIEYVLAAGATDGDTATRNLVATFHVDRGADGSIDNTLEISEHSGDRTTSIPDLTRTDIIYVTLRIDTRGLSGSSNLGGTLRIRAGS